jgi:hypothetical protein
MTTGGFNNQPGLQRAAGSFCEHNQTEEFWECGAAACEHGRQKAQCKVWPGSGVCGMAEQSLYNASSAAAVAVCEHDRQKSMQNSHGAVWVCVV